MLPEVDPEVKAIFPAQLARSQGQKKPDWGTNEVT